MLADRMMDMYWSLVTIFKMKPVPTVAATRPNVLLISRRRRLVRLNNIPLATITPPKHMAQRISHMVFSIPAIPPVDTSSFRASLPVSMLVDDAKVIIRAFVRFKALGTSSPMILIKTSGCRMTAQIPAASEDRNRVVRAGIFFAIRKAVSTGTSKVQSEMLKLISNPSVYSEMLTSWLCPYQSPITKNIRSVMVIVGIVVMSMYRI